MSPDEQLAITRDARWESIVRRDKRADGSFWYSVTTTGIYCRPSCASRAARPEHVRIHDTLEAARASGARACRRCNPEGSSRQAETAAIVESACRTIEASETLPTLAELADAAGLSAGHFHRLFRSTTGLTPRAYAVAHRARRVRDSLREENRVTDAIYAAGFSSSSRFYDSASAMLGMSPGHFRSGGASETLHFAVGQSSLGAILVASSRKGVAAILIGDDPDEVVRLLQDQFPRADLIGGEPGYEALVARVVGLVEEPQLGLDLPLDVRGTAFQQRVWQALQRIPPGQSITYSELAQRIGMPGAARAVASACAANRHAVVIPCHRVIRSDGSVSGYRWGVDRKRRLLTTEAAGCETSG